MTDHDATTGAGRPSAGDPAAASAAPAPGGRWQVSIGSARGAAHLIAGLPNQDAARQDDRDPGGAVIVAIADGHGHSRHFRSGAGSVLAVDTACQVAALLTAGLARRAQQVALGQAEVDAAVRAELAPALVRNWRAAVAAHLAGQPFTPDEQARLDALGDEPEIPYGATLLVVTVLAHWLICAQIGDGDILAIRPDGQSFSPVPMTEKLDGERTRSLCQPDALAAFRVGVHDLDTQPLVALLLATDGYGNAQTADPWQPGVGRDLARFAAERDHGWFERQVPGWAERCASADGSGDDTTIALLVHPDPAAAASAARQVPVTAGPDPANAETQPAGVLAPPSAAGRAEPAHPKTAQVQTAPPRTAQAETVEMDRAGPAGSADTRRTGPPPASPPPASPAPASPAPASPAPAERTLPIRKAPPGSRSAAPAGGPSAPPTLPRIQVPGAGPRGPAPAALPPTAGITSSRRAVFMIAGAIALAAIVAAIVVLLALRPAAAPAPAPARHAQSTSPTSTAAGPPPGRTASASGGSAPVRTHKGHRAGRSAGHQREGVG